MLRIILCGLLTIGLCGCTNVKQDEDETTAQNENAETENDQPKRRSPGGGVSSMFLPVEDDRPRGASGKNKSNPQPAKTKSDSKRIAKVESRIVEWPKYGQENPEVVEADTKIDGFDPYSSAASAYVNIPDRVRALGTQANARIQSELNRTLEGGRSGPLSFEEFVKDFKQSGRNLKSQRPYRLYGYNPETGKVHVLEDKALKRKIYKEKGIPLEE